MSDSDLLGLPAPDDGQPHESTGGQAAGSAGRSQRRGFRSIEECLAALDQLPGMLLMGVITAAQLNAIRGALRDNIAVQQRTASGAAAAPMDHAVLRRLREDPELMNLMAPLLTADQIAWLMGASAKDEIHG
jgi:hypothetical protein